MNSFWEGLFTLGTGFLVLAGLSVALSRKAQTPAVIQSTASGFGNVLAVAESPVTGTAISPVLSYPGSDMSGSFGYGTA